MERRLTWEGMESVIIDAEEPGLWVFEWTP